MDKNRVAVPRGRGQPRLLNDLGCLTRRKWPESAERGRFGVSTLSVPRDTASPLARYVIEAPADRSFTVTLTPILPACEPVPEPQAAISSSNRESQ
jgi:hypothetical protein